MVYSSLLMRWLKICSFPAQFRQFHFSLNHQFLPVLTGRERWNYTYTPGCCHHYRHQRQCRSTRSFGWQVKREYQSISVNRVTSWLLTQQKRSCGDAETCQMCRSAADLSSGAAKHYKQLWLANHVESELWDAQYATMLSVDNDSPHGCRSNVTFIFVPTQNVYGFFLLIYSLSSIYLSVI